MPVSVAPPDGERFAGPSPRPRWQGGLLSLPVSRRFGQAMRLHLPALRRYALGLTASRAAADDLVQDCIERGLRRADSLQDERQLAGWLRAILFNLFIDQRRQRLARGEEQETAVLDDIAAVAAGPEQQTEVLEVMRAMSRLSPEHRQMLLLAGVDGLSYREIATELAVPIGTVMSRLARARDQLRATLAEQDRTIR